jgi:hypothetical protein
MITEWESTKRLSGKGSDPLENPECNFILVAKALPCQREFGLPRAGEATIVPAKLAFTSC